MTKPDHNIDATLEQAWQTRKVRAKAPDVIKQQIMAKARRVEKGHNETSMSRWFWQLGAAASVILFFVVFLMPSGNRPLPETDQVTWLEVKSAHTVDTRKVSIGEELQQIEQHYAQRHQLIAADRQLARLTYSDKDRWTFETCDHQEIILSGQLLAMLQKYELAAPNIQPGTPVFIGFDDEGRITGIDDSRDGLVCE